MAIFLICSIVISATALYTNKKAQNYDKNLYLAVYDEYKEIEEDINTDVLNIHDINLNEETIKGFYEKIKSENVIGRIKIEKINIEYPILDKTTEELMKIAPTKYCGPRVNGVGNLVLIGHNFYNGTLFSNLNNLVVGNKVEITDLSGDTLTYKVYEKKVIEPTDFSCTKQNDNTKCELTLITCINGTDNRLVVKCLEDT